MQGIELLDPLPQLPFDAPPVPSPPARIFPFTHSNFVAFSVIFLVMKKGGISVPPWSDHASYYSSTAWNGLTSKFRVTDPIFLACPRCRPMMS